MTRVEKTHADVKSFRFARRGAFVAAFVVALLFARIISADEAAEIAIESVAASAPEETRTPIRPVDDANKQSSRADSGLDALVSTVGALALVLFVFFALWALARVLIGGRALDAPSRKGGAVVLERTRIDAKSELLVVQWLGKLILVARSPDGWTPIAEETNEETTANYLAELERARVSNAERKIWTALLPQKKTQNNS